MKLMQGQLMHCKMLAVATVLQQCALSRLGIYGYVPYGWV